MLQKLGPKGYRDAIAKALADKDISADPALVNVNVGIPAVDAATTVLGGGVLRHRAAGERRHGITAVDAATGWR